MQNQPSSMERINKFRDDRNWRQFHNEKDLAISISIEAAELLEIFQWKTSEEATQDFEHLKEEIADVLIYSYMLADNLGLDIDEIIKEKLEKNNMKYSVKESKDSKKKYNEL
ncbi:MULTISPECIES: nucleotide pyrophosphohydrolase [Enterococcus]|uniref:Nucleotide pyrophosphohydrolase n=1 Tax=Enterococcus casseliflavus TaxID=37734 RepID=A0ABD6YX35_ENTCA|nr:nucleotide pyrophosphohydrolase [Enterococcus casseliflavus]EOH83258.1 MazG nucleotide pyrophosphohydrolase [Enterococcus casseliflavus ATCC 49996]EOU10002.1 MazG nucleotide pyrophosphohydrolase [Enterococcus casseliflavus ATCC 49996]MBE9879665.1 nucleotide pyrophosphohydrolase [Enterococcus casseliflavus]MCD5161747.1 nucleotide pyrophosphohydrolase [Enterococcus casseliflavus]MCD5190338.1 nucleotide pyrophosphohydrolase [Enterococcus casseliflavus]